MFVLEDGEKVDLKTLNNYLKEGKNFIVKDIEDKEGNNFLDTIAAPEIARQVETNPITTKMENIEFSLIKIISYSMDSKILIRCQRTLKIFYLI